ncbi:uncharacterized protein LOC121383296 [Gigantopelta aegis]|uniref:uncharacterized protein LOC121383296 n=1 Tax=Gigantopelta aegis TaxID=1735272 RepID=UPI001B887FD9|nr:uncharacterized protein LOC121383296 [Gigantopelta aegis]
MKRRVLLSILVLGVFGVPAQFRLMQRGRLLSPLWYPSSKDHLGLLSRRSEDSNAFTESAYNSLKLRTLLNILKRKPSYGIPRENHSFLFERQREKKLARECDATRITPAQLREYLMTRRICGFRVSSFRFGLGGRKR